MQIAASMGATVVAIDIDQARLDMMAEHGADVTINSDETDFKALRGEIRKLAKETAAGGVTIVPTKLYLKGGRIKIEIALAKGKRAYDKRERARKRSTGSQSHALPSRKWKSERCNRRIGTSSGSARGSSA